MTIFERVQELSRKQGKTLQKVANDLGFGDNYLYTLKKQKPKTKKVIVIVLYFRHRPTCFRKAGAAAADLCGPQLHQ